MSCLKFYFLCSAYLFRFGCCGAIIIKVVFYGYLRKVSSTFSMLAVIISVFIFFEVCIVVLLQNLSDVDAPLRPQ